MDQKKLIQLTTDVYGTYKDLHMSEKEREEKLLQEIQSANGLKAWVGAEKGDGKAQENQF